MNETKDITMDVVSRGAELITEMHNEAKKNLNNAIQCAIRAGQELMEMKKEIPYGEWGEWITENLPFNERTAQRYMKIAENADTLLKIEPDSLSDAYKAIEEPKKKEKVRVEAHIEDDDEEEWDEPIVSGPKERPEKTMYPYWPVLKEGIEKLESVYNKLAATRDHTTPESVGNMIGNIKEMSNRLREWDPENLFDCPRCLGKKTIKKDEQIVSCPICINGKVGPYRKTEL